MPPSWTYHQPAFEHVPDPRASWAGHRRFAYDLVRNLRPGRIVELGVCLGTSFFAFSQAIKDGGLKTELWGVDTWKGDEHVGFYGPDYRRRFEEVRQAHFAGVPVRMYDGGFDDARKQFARGTIDLLHIDGCHTYEAARHDFETWEDAVRPGGVVLFHDIGVRDGTFGVWRLWDELKQRHDTAEFSHSFGLGVLLAPPVPPGLAALAEEWRRRYGTAAVDAPAPR